MARNTGRAQAEVGRWWLTGPQPLWLDASLGAGWSLLLASRSATEKDACLGEGRPSLVLFSASLGEELRRIEPITPSMADLDRPCGLCSWSGGRSTEGWAWMVEAPGDGGVVGVTGLAAAGEGGVCGPPAASSTEPSWNLTPLVEPPPVMTAYVSRQPVARVSRDASGSAWTAMGAVLGYGALGAPAPSAATAAHSCEEGAFEYTEDW